MKTSTLAALALAAFLLFRGGPAKKTGSGAIATDLNIPPPRI